MLYSLLTFKTKKGKGEAGSWQQNLELCLWRMHPHCQAPHLRTVRTACEVGHHVMCEMGPHVVTVVFIEGMMGSFTPLPLSKKKKVLGQRDMSFWGPKSILIPPEEIWLVRVTFSLRSGAVFTPWWAQFCSVGAPWQCSSYSPQDIQSPHLQGLALLSYKCKRVFLYNLSLSSVRPKGKSVTGWMSVLWTGCCLITNRAENNKCSQWGGVTEHFVVTQRPGSCFLPAAAWVLSRAG